MKLKKVSAKRKEPLNAYDDFIAINNTLRDYSRSLELFVWLDTNKPDLAKAIFERAQYYLIPALIEAKQYQLCGKYIDPNTSVDKILQLYRETTKHAIESNDTSLKNFEDQFLINRVTTIIALLSITDRKADAQQIVDRISKESDLPEFKPEIKKALDGEIPPQSP